MNSKKQIILNSHYDLILCDSKEALKFCYSKGLSKNIKVITSSPSILLDSTINSQSLFKIFPKSKYIKFQKSIFSFSLQLYQEVLKNNNFEKEIATLIAILGNHINNFLLKIAQIDNYYFNKKILFIKIDEKLKNSHLINPPWSYISDILQITTYEYTPENYSNINLNNEVKANFFSRIFLGGWETLLYRALMQLSKKIRFNNKKNIILINENEIIIELVAKLFLKGYKINDFRYIKLNKNAHINSSIIKLKECIDPILNNRLKLWIEKDFVNISKKYFYDELKYRIDQYLLWKDLFKKHIQEIKGKSSHKTFTLINHPASPKGLALKNICNRFNILLCSCQHGVTAELSASHDYCLSQHDSSSSDIFLAFNPGAADVAKKNPFNASQAFVYGAPKRYKRTRYNFYKKNKYNILYLSNNLFTGNISGLSVWANDLEKAKVEINILNLLKRINKKVFYKPYPEINKRYYESNPCIIKANEINNINIIKNNYDARYYLNQSDLLICPSASSTVSWALMSNTPILFINFKYLAPLNQKAYNAFKKGLFLFNYDDINFVPNMINFLNTPAKEINAMWNKKKLDRQRLINSLISGKKESNVDNIF